LKKHIKAFVTGFSGAAEFRARLMEADSADALEAMVADSGLLTEK
jgi:tRNA-dihydrouridine synthase